MPLTPIVPSRRSRLSALATGTALALALIGTPAVAQDVETLRAQVIIAQEAVAAAQASGGDVDAALIALDAAQRQLAEAEAAAAAPVESPAPEAPAPEAPVAEPAAPEVPAPEAAPVEQPVVEEPVVEQPVVEEPVAEQPVVEDPIVEIPVAPEAPVAVETPAAPEAVAPEAEVIELPAEAAPEAPAAPAGSDPVQVEEVTPETPAVPEAEVIEEPAEAAPVPRSTDSPAAPVEAESAPVEQSAPVEEVAPVEDAPPVEEAPVQTLSPAGTDEITPSAEALEAVRERRRRGGADAPAAPEAAPAENAGQPVPAPAPNATEVTADPATTDPVAPAAAEAEPVLTAPVSDPEVAAEQSGIAAPADDLAAADAAVAEAEAALAAARASGEGVGIARARLRAARFDRRTLIDPLGASGEADPVVATDEGTVVTPAAPAAPDATANTTINNNTTVNVQTEAPRVVPDSLTTDQRELIAAQDELRRERQRRERAELIGAAAAGLAIGAIVPQLGGRVVEDTGDRVVVQDGDTYFIVRDENELLRDRAADVIQRDLGGGLVETSFVFPDGSEVITVRDPGGTVLKRSRVRPDGVEIVLFDDTVFPEAPPVAIDYALELPPLSVPIPQERYIVEASQVGAETLIETFEAPAVEEVERAYTLTDVRRSERLRDKVRRVDLDAITFDTGSASVRRSQLPFLDEVGIAMSAAVAESPDTVFLVEGHTDAVGSEVYNLTLSDRRAETVAALLTDRYGVPPENLVVEGYGERYLKVATEASERANRRVTVRNITPLLSAGQ